MAGNAEEKTIYGTDGTMYCKPYQGARSPGQTACPHVRNWRLGANLCSNGVHKCFGCGKGGHGKQDCKYECRKGGHGKFECGKGGHGKKRPFNAFGKDLGEGGQKGTAIGKGVGGKEQRHWERCRRKGYWETGTAIGKGVGGSGQRAIASTGMPVAMPVVNPVDLMIWRPSDMNKHGFACVFQFACSMMNRSRVGQMPLHIHLNQANTIYDSFTKPHSQALWWDDVFVQPYVRSLQNHPETVNCINDYMKSTVGLMNGLSSNDYTKNAGVTPPSLLSTKNAGVIPPSLLSQSSLIKMQLVNPPANELMWNCSGVWGPSKDGGLNQHKVKETRSLVKQFTGFTLSFQQLLADEAMQINMDGNGTLAVHLRLTDKVHNEAKENGTLSNEMVVSKIKTCMDKMGYTKVFFCSDNKTRKTQIQEMLKSQAIHCITYGAILSDNEDVGLHFSSVPKHTQCRDVAIEVSLMARYCKGLLCSRSNMSFMIAVLADEDYAVFDMLSDTHVGPMHYPASMNASSVNTFRSDLNNQVEGMWLDHDTCVFQIRGAKYEFTNGLFLTLLQSHVIINSIDEYEHAIDKDEAAERLQGFLAEWHHILVIKITRFEPARVGWGTAQNRKLMKHAAALSVLVPLLLDKCGGICENQLVSSLCTLAAAQRPPAAEDIVSAKTTLVASAARTNRLQSANTY